MIAQFTNGIRCALDGCRDFFHDRHALRYALLPIGCMLALYIAAAFGVVVTAEHLASWLNQASAGLPSWLAWLQSCNTAIIYIIASLLGILFIGYTFTLLYELFGGIFFGALLAYYEQKQFGIAPYEASLLENIGFCMEGIWFGIKNALWLLVCMVLGLFIPLAGQLLGFLLMGYTMGFVYILASGNNRGLHLQQVMVVARKHNCAILGFGLTTYVLAMIPLGIVFLLPGFVMGGSRLFNACHTRT